MAGLPWSITVTIALLAAFLVFITVLKYAVESPFVRTRLIMSSFFLFIVATLTVSFSDYFLATLPFTVPAGFLGVLVGSLVGVPAAEARLKTEGVRNYIKHFAHVHIDELKDVTWWSVINFYSIISALVLINLVGLTTVLLHNLKPMALLTSAFGAFLIGTIIPYLAHLWSIKVKG